MPKQEHLKEYAELIVRVGANVQTGQTLVINCPVENAAFARLLAGAAYDAGAREVTLIWNDDALTRMKYLRAADEVFDTVREWLVVQQNGYADERAALIGVMASDPELLKDADPGRIQRYARASGVALKSVMEKTMNNEFQWCGVSVPSPAWAKKVFPGADEDAAVEKLWDAILKCVHVGKGGAVGIWKEKTAEMARRAGMLTEYAFDRLIYKNSLGTDLTVGLPEGHRWVACGEKAKTGADFVANMPTEEIFTLPKKDAVNGVLRASMPLSLDGNMVNDITFTLKDGKIVEAGASSGLDVLQKKLDLDEGARYLGEAALVPFHSPINDMGILFYNTLFDENASCHFAFGKAYPAFTGELTPEEMAERGANDSLTHIDFMVGTEDLSVTGVTRGGEEIPVFINGDFAF